MTRREFRAELSQAAGRRAGRARRSRRHPPRRTSAGLCTGCVPGTRRVARAVGDQEHGSCSRIRSWSRAGGATDRCRARRRAGRGSAGRTSAPPGGGRSVEREHQQRPDRSRSGSAPIAASSTARPLRVCPLSSSVGGDLPRSHPGAGRGGGGCRAAPAPREAKSDRAGPRHRRSALRSSSAPPTRSPSRRWRVPSSRSSSNRRASIVSGVRVERVPRWPGGEELSAAEGFQRPTEVGHVDLDRVGRPCAAGAHPTAGR